MRPTKTNLLASAVLGLYGTTPAVAGKFTYLSVAPTGLTSGTRTGMTAGDSVVGYYYDNAGYPHAYIFAKGTLTLVDFAGSAAAAFLAVNAKGTAMADYLDRNSIIHYGRTTLAGTNFKPVKLLHTSRLGAVAINASGVIAGTLINYTGHRHRTMEGFMATGKTGVALMPPNSFECTATGINDSGTIVGTSFTSSSVQIYTFQNGAYTTFSWPGTGESYGTIISNTGAVGGYIDNNDEDTQYAVIGGSAVQIAVPGALSTSLAGFGPGDEVVGNWTKVSGGNGYGCIYTGGVYYTIKVPGVVSTTIAGVNINGDLYGSASSTGAIDDTIFAVVCAPRERPCTK